MKTILFQSIILGMALMANAHANPSPDVQSLATPPANKIITLAHHINKSAGPYKKPRGYRFPKTQAATGNRTFIFDPRRKRWAAYDPDGRLVSEGRASGGKGYCRDVGRSCRTVRGQFRVYTKGSGACKSSKYPLRRNGRNGGAPMPYCMFFHRGYAIHGSPSVPNHNASHGCIRVRPKAARWLSKEFIRIGTTVIVKPY